MEAVNTQGHLPWYMANAIAFIVFMISIFVLIFYGLTSIANVSEISKNWSEYRCDPAIMPFASLYGYNTAENFNYCMGNIFGTYSSDMTSSFSTVLGSFSSVIGVLMTAINSVRTSVATLGGGINVVFQNFTNRITLFFYTLRVSAIRIKTLIGRMYAIMFAVMYMGMSAVTGLTSFTNTTLFSFLDTFCFPADTKLTVEGRGETAIRDVRIGDILLPTRSRVTATFAFHARGQGMVQFARKLGHLSEPILVSTNHYIWDLVTNGWVRADEHSEARPAAAWGDEPLYCLNTSDHIIPIDKYRFNDYDETSAADKKTMRMVQDRVNGKDEKAMSSSPRAYVFQEYSPAMGPTTELRMRDGRKKSAESICLGDELITGAKVVGTIRREVQEVVEGPAGVFMTPATLVWREDAWVRAGEYMPICKLQPQSTSNVYVAFIVTPSSQIELADGTRIRDYMEFCSPDAERYYAQELKQLIL